MDRAEPRVERRQLLRGQQPVGRAVAVEGVARHAGSVELDHAERGRRVEQRTQPGVHVLAPQRAHQAFAEHVLRQAAQEGHRLAKASQADGDVERRAAGARVQVQGVIGFPRRRRRRFLWAFASDEDVEQGFATNQKHDGNRGVD